MDKVVEDGKIGEDKPFDLFANDLVIVTAEDSDDRSSSIWRRPAMAATPFP